MQDQVYIAIYTPDTGELIAICNDEDQYGVPITFWVPGDRYFGYATNYSFVRLFDRETGNVYTLPNAGFAGWIASNEDPAAGSD